MEEELSLQCRNEHSMDFQQGLITTVHDYSLGNLDPEVFNRELAQRPTALLIPCLMEEFHRPALALIRDTLSGLKGLNKLVIALSADCAEDVAYAEAFFTGMPLASFLTLRYFFGSTGSGMKSYSSKKLLTQRV